MQSRYYNPELGRFINADSYTSTGQGVLGNNMFAYCGNNPISFSDPSGHARKQLPFCLNDDPGYIYDQSDSPWGDMPFGSSTIAAAGCALVAIYNAMITLGDPRSFSEIYEFFENYPSGLMDHGENGVFLLYVAAYFYHEGYSVFIVSSQNADQIEMYSEHADACIMLYQYKTDTKSGGHYIEYEWDFGHYIGRNTIDNNGRYEFTSPIEYGLSDSRSVFWSIFVFKPN